LPDDHSRLGASPMLSRLLDQGRRYAPEFGAGLSNHLPMALIALNRLGAADDRLLSFESSYASRLKPAAHSTANESATASISWHLQLGDIGAFGAMRAQIKDALANNGIDAELRKALEVVLPGCGAAAFHGLIRSAYALEAGHTDELASGLAYWACRHLPLRKDFPERGACEVEAWAARIETPLAAWRSTKGLISERMLEVSQMPVFIEALDGLRTGPDTLQRLSAMAAQRYLQTQDFTVLHLITSCHALRLLMPWISEPDAALRWYALAYAAGLLASHARALYPPVAAPCFTPWDTVIQRAIASDDDHVIKLTYTCQQEAAHYGDDRYHRVAELAISN
jgi:Questin oxidase-like